MKDPGAWLDSGNSGVYAAPRAIGALKRAAQAHAIAWIEVDLAGVDDKTAFLSRCSKAFALPATFGHNWDALADTLQDLAWLPAAGYVVFCADGADFARDAPDDFATALAIFSDAARFWRAQGRVFIALFDAGAARRGRLRVLAGRDPV